jgi:hydrogenase/urease accessory protein HupE
MNHTSSNHRERSASVRTAVIAALAAPALAQAHPGHHDATSLLSSLWHWVTSPFHMAIVAGAVGLVLVARRLSRITREKAKTPSRN